MKLVWKNGSGSTLATETFDGNSQSKAHWMLEELLMNDWRKFGDHGDSITVLFDDDETEDDDEADETGEDGEAEAPIDRSKTYTDEDGRLYVWVPYYSEEKNDDGSYDLLDWKQMYI